MDDVVRRVIRAYIAAIDARDGGRVCALLDPGAIEQIELPAEHRECAASLDASIEEDLVYLLKDDGEWLVARPSLALYRAVGKLEAPTRARWRLRSEIALSAACQRATEMIRSAPPWSTVK